MNKEELRLYHKKWKKEHKDKMKPLRQVNRTKYCPLCKEIVEIEVIGKEGYCKTCLARDRKTKLFTFDNKK